MKGPILFAAALLSAQGIAGDLIWERTVPITELHPYPYYLLGARSGGVYIVAFSRHHDAQSDWDELELRRYAADGTLLWQQTGGYEFRSGIWNVLLAEDPTGNVYVGTQSQEIFGGPTQPKLFRFSPTGTLLWSAFALERRNVSIKANQNSSFYWAHGSRTQLRASSGSVLWDIAQTGKLYPKGPWEALQDRDTTIAILGAVGEIRTFPTVAPRVDTDGRMISESRYVRGEDNYLRCYDMFGNVVWATLLDGEAINIESDSRHVFVVTWPILTVFWLDHQGNILRQTQNSFEPSGSFMDGIGGGFLTRNTRDRHTRHFGLVSVETDGATGHAAGVNSDFYAAAYSPGMLIVRRYQNGIDHLSATLTRGTTLEHSHYALMHSGDGYWSVAPGITLSTQQAPVSILFKYLAPPEPPSQMGMIIESRASASAVRQQVEAYNFATLTWVTLETNVQMPAGAQPDRYAVIDIPDPAAFLDPATNQVHVRVEYRAVGPVLAYPWQARLDRTMLRYVK